MPLAAQGRRRLAVAVDASALWLEAVEAVVGRLGIEVVAKATNCEQAIAAVEEYHPQLLVTDVTLASPDDGLDCIRRARAEHPDLRVIVLSICVDWDIINSAFALGAAVYVMKTAHADDLSTAVRQAFDPSVYFAGAAGRPAGRVITPVVEEDVHPREDVILTKREREILRLVAEGHSNAHLARLLWVAEQTVKFHLSNVYRKLGVSNRTEAARWAQVNGLLATPPSVPSVSSAELAAG